LRSNAGYNVGGVETCGYITIDAFASVILKSKFEKHKLPQWHDMKTNNRRDVVAANNGMGIMATYREIRK
jgi:hypothetical protein